MSRLKTICAWCKKVISEVESEKDLISHGICEACAEKVEKEEEENHDRHREETERDTKPTGSGYDLR